MKKVNKKIKRKASHKKQSNKQSNELSRLIVEARNYYDQRQLEQSNYLYQQVLEIDPDNLLALNGLGIVAMDTGMLSLAIDLFNIAYEIDPANLTVNKNLALVHTRLNDYEAAIQHYIQIVNMDEKNGEVHGELARLYLQTGELELALKHYRLAFDLNPGDPRNLHGLVQMDAKSISEDHLIMVEKLLQNPRLPLDDRSSFYFALGTIYDAKERYDEAFANYSVANISKASKFDTEKHAAYVTDVMHTFTAELFEEYSVSELNNSTQPVFIVGMPRSGTTLVEQILASHTNIYAAGELGLIGDIAQKLNITAEQTEMQHLFLQNTSAASLNSFAQFYLNAVNNLSLKDGHDKALITTDKLPTNFLYLGLIALLFPNARIIHCRRNPLDVSLSCYFQSFAGDHGYACDLNNIAQYYRQYERLMAHWEKVLPVEIHTVDYEEMTKQPETTSKALIEFLDIDWQTSCMEFYKTKRHVNTASLVQVRQKMYRSSVDRWRHYDKYLHYLKKTLSVYDCMDDATKIAIMNAHNTYNSEILGKYLH